jgi:polyferredoxin
MVKREDVDIDGDGVISDEELAIYLEAKRREMEDEDAKRDQQRKMVWFALFGMLLYPLFVFGTEALGFSNASGVIGDMAPTYFMAVSVVVGAFFGADAYVKGKDKNDDKKDKK